MRVTVNGKEREVAGPTALISYLKELEIDMRHIAVALNGTVLREDELSGALLSESDRVEIVRAVGGG